ncbi:hypothetical protein [Parvularcula dongshanensis]|uniref:hypothetical protein n=1 Tax=Parvularcula dongshanensis TaxID=1173995 RepID=UPI00160FB89E|nr:hypothetical protein [Parvularcula dongshanensis]
MPVALWAVAIFVGGCVWARPANEIGDFLAGFAGSLSFLWIIATILLQREELELQRAEIKALAAESKSQSSYLLTGAKFDLIQRWSSWLNMFSQKNETVLARSAHKMMVSIF